MLDVLIVVDCGSIHFPSYNNVPTGHIQLKPPIVLLHICGELQIISPFNAATKHSLISKEYEYQ